MISGTLMKLNGQPLSIKNSKIEKCIEFLETLPDDEVLTGHELQTKNIATRTTSQRWAKENPRMAFYSHLVNDGGFWVYGNPRAIITVRKQTEKTTGRT